MGYTRKGGMYTPTQSQFRQINIRSSKPEERQGAIESIRKLRNKIVCNSEKSLENSLIEYETLINSYIIESRNGAAVNYIMNNDLLLTKQFQKKNKDKLSKTKKRWWNNESTETKRDKINNEYKKKFCSNFEIVPLVDVLVYNYTDERHPTTYNKIKEVYDIIINNDSFTSGEISTNNFYLYDEKINKNGNNLDSSITRNSEPTYSNSLHDSTLLQTSGPLRDSALSQRKTEVFNHSKSPRNSTISQRDSNISTISSLTSSSSDAPQTKYKKTPFARNGDFFQEVSLDGGKRTRRKYKKKYKKKV